MLHVDEGVKQVVSQTENFFEKNTTAYVFASDHGMTDWGSHGSGSPDETETPFVVWGTGVANTARFHDIEQADLTPLISALIGIPVPVNNEVSCFEENCFRRKCWLPFYFLWNSKSFEAFKLIFSHSFYVKVLHD